MFAGLRREFAGVVAFCLILLTLTVVALLLSVRLQIRFDNIVALNGWAANLTNGFLGGFIGASVASLAIWWNGRQAAIDREHQWDMHKQTIDFQIRRDEQQREESRKAVATAIYAEQSSNRRLLEALVRMPNSDGELASTFHSSFHRHITLFSPEAIRQVIRCYQLIRSIENVRAEYRSELARETVSVSGQHHTIVSMAQRLLHESQVEAELMLSAGSLLRVMTVEGVRMSVVGNDVGLHIESQTPIVAPLPPSTENDSGST